MAPRSSRSWTTSWAAASAVLDPSAGRVAEALVLGRAGSLTPGGLRSAIARAVMEIAPDKARKRREQAESVKRIAKEDAMEVQKPGAQRSEVHVAGGKMIAAGQVIEFVAKIAVTRGENNLNEDGEAAE